MNMMCFLLSITNRMKQLWPNCIKFLAAVNELLINIFFKLVFYSVITNYLIVSYLD